MNDGGDKSLDLIVLVCLFFPRCRPTLLLELFLPLGLGVWLVWHCTEVTVGTVGARGPFGSLSLSVFVMLFYCKRKYSI